MENIKETLFEDKIVRWFLRSLTGVLLVFYTYYIIHSKLTIGKPNLTAQDVTIIVSGIAIWATWEAVRVYLNKKLANK